MNEITIHDNFPKLIYDPANLKILDLICVCLCVSCCLCILVCMSHYDDVLRYMVLMRHLFVYASVPVSMCDVCMSVLV